MRAVARGLSLFCWPVVDANAPSYAILHLTILSQDGKSATIYVWYDNEYGYTCQVMRLAKYVAGVRRKVYY